MLPADAMPMNDVPQHHGAQLLRPKWRQRSSVKLCVLVQSGSDARSWSTSRRRQLAVVKAPYTEYAESQALAGEGGSVKW